MVFFLRCLIVALALSYCGVAVAQHTTSATIAVIATDTDADLRATDAVDPRRGATTRLLPEP